VAIGRAEDRDLPYRYLKASWRHWLLRFGVRAGRGGRTARVISLCPFDEFCELGVASQDMRRSGLGWQVIYVINLLTV
jgi:hypothetical protein